ncbi:MAG: trypsin-like peptidase domain-containing protein [Planctomycetes bacterium]|nr:trypsin-like peptidase domain-containing protein [Planctomycetota bacterium]
MHTRVISLSLCAVLLLSCTVHTDLHASAARETAARRAVRRAKSAVVNIHSERVATRDRDPDSTPGRKVNGMGTGIIVDERGYIVTNQHVVHGVESLRVVLFDGSTYAAKVVKVNATQDLAVIKINAARPLPVMPLGTSSDLELGETVLAIGNAFGYEHTVTQGIISSLSRDVEVNEHQAYKNLLQTDASINPGNSGGPLINLDGEVIGINVAIRAGAQRIGFAIPIDDARGYIAALLDIRELDHNYHGIVGHDIKTPDQRKLVIDTCEPNSPAASAGFHAGDIVTRVGAIPVQDLADLERAFLGQSAGAPVDVVVLRDQEPVTLTVQLARVDDSKLLARNVKATRPVNVARPKTQNTEESIATRCWDVLGMKLEKLKSNSKQLDAFRDKYRGGMKVVDVKSGSIAADYGIKRGDVLVGLHIWETVRWDDINYILNQASLINGPEGMKFYVVRGQEVLYGSLRTASAQK